MSTVSQQLEALREQKENLDFRIAELERSAKWEAQNELRRGEPQHKEDLENIMRLRTDVTIVTSNSALVRLLDAFTIGGATPHSEGRAWAGSERSDIRMLNVNNGISMPRLDGEAWPGDNVSVSGVFSYSRLEGEGPSDINYPKGSMIDFDLLYSDGIRGLRKGLVLTEGTLLQLVPEKKVYASLGTWIVDLGRPSFGAVRVRLPDPRTRHQKMQDALNKMGSFHEKIAHITAEYRLKQVPVFRESPNDSYKRLLRMCQSQQEYCAKEMQKLKLGEAGAADILLGLGRRLKRMEYYKDAEYERNSKLSEEERNKITITIWHQHKSYLYVKSAEYGACVVAHACTAGPLNGVYYCEGSATHKWAPQGPTQVFLLWRGQEIAFNV